jgi:serine/threonine protein kinase
MKPSPTSTNYNNESEEEGSTVDVQHEQQCGNRNNNNTTMNNNAPPAQHKQQAWFQSSVMARTEAYIEAQVMQLTNDCRLFQDEEQDEQNCLALFQRHEIQTAWTLVGNGAFSEVYTVQNIRLLDGGFVDPVQQQARESLRNAVDAVPTLDDQQQPSNERLQKYVVKHLRRDLLANRKKFIHAAGDLVLEAMYLSKLHHPNIINLKGCAVGGPSAYSDGRHDGFFLILEKLDCTLSQRIQQWERLASSGRCPASARTVYSKDLVDFEEKLDLANQVGLALEYLHLKDIIFRDLKPDNIGIIRKPHGKSIVKLFDFGLCRELPEASPKEETVFHMSGVGTRRYMSPEVFLGQYYNVKADVYSWTMCLHAMLSLQRPFEMYNAELHKLLVCQEGVRPTIYKDWPAEIQTILREGWAADPKDRPRMGEICSTITGLLQEIKSIKIETGTDNPDYVKVAEEEIPEETCTAGSATFVGFASFVDSLAQSWCSGTSNANANNNGATRRNKRSILRTLESHLVADVAGTQLLMMRDHPHPHFRDRVGADYPQMRHLRSGYL